MDSLKPKNVNSVTIYSPFQTCMTFLLLGNTKSVHLKEFSVYIMQVNGYQYNTGPIFLS